MHLWKMSVIYVLKLKDDKIYVGETTDINRRMEQHEQGTASSWTKKYPVVELVGYVAKTGPFDEDTKVKELMLIHGIDNVRGGTYSSIQLSHDIIRMLQREMTHCKGHCFNCGNPGHFASECTMKKSEMTTIMPPVTKTITCFRCGEIGHYANNCPPTRKGNEDMCLIA